MNRALITTVIIFTTTGLLVAYDVWASFQPGGTISEVMLKMAHYHPIIPFALGILMGHFFWSQQMESHWQTQSSLMYSSGKDPNASADISVPSRQRPPGLPRRPANLLLWLGLVALLIGILLAMFVK